MSHSGPHSSILAPASPATHVRPANLSPPSLPAFAFPVILPPSLSPAYTPPLKRTATFTDAFTAGAVGLSLAYAVMHPLDTLKTLVQANVHSSSTHKPPIGWFGTLRLLSRGFSASTTGAAIQGGLRLSTYEATKKIIDSHTNAYPILSTTFAALMGDLVSSIVKVPREVVTVRMQTNYYSGSNPPRTAMQTVSRIVRDEGPIALWQGFGPIIARDGPFMIVLFVTYELFKARYHTVFGKGVSTVSVSANSDSLNNEPTISTAQSIIFGGISGALAGFSTTPMDVLRTRVLTTTSHQIRPPPSIIQGLTDIYRVGGVSCMFCGAIARSAWWFGICAVFFPTYEAVKNHCIANRD